jgi:hypothetical protein
MLRDWNKEQLYNMAPTIFFPISFEMEIEICLEKNPTNQTGCHDKQKKNV